MTYSNKFVMSVLLNGTPQKELANGVVKLPFGTEYSLRFRNKNNRRAVVHILIDGEDVSGNGYIVPANSHVDIKRHHDVDRSFKFVSLDSADAVDFGKNGPNEDKVKGTIEARFYLEKELPQCAPTSVEHHHHHYYPRPKIAPIYPPVYPVRPQGPIWQNANQTQSYGGRDIRRSRRITDGTKGATKGIFLHDEIKTCSVDTNNTSELYLSLALKDGCTVEGNTTGQRFTSQHIEVEDNYTTLKLFLQGHDGPIESVSSLPKTQDRPTNKDLRLTELEAENEALRKKLAEIENEELKKKLAQKNESKAPRKSRAKKEKLNKE